ncbi:MAG TPA: DUF5995 family protein [Actinomycetota bacterium]|nr:DUF5995 family protein [Actinomycetota bacterium]
MKTGEPGDGRRAISTPNDVLKDLLKQPKVKTTDQVVARMRLIDQTLPTRDGVAWFNKLYLKTTENVLAAVGEGFFKYPELMSHLDIVFANLYFQALHDSLHKPDGIPRAWRPLFSERSRRGIAPIQFAIAGMNAHINRDLAIAVVQSCKDMKMRPDARVKKDYDLVNPILQSTQDEIKVWFATGFVGVLDEIFGRLDDVMANWSIGRARDAGWVNSVLLWEIRDKRLLRSAFLQNMDHTVGFAGRGLLIPTA